MNQIRVYLAIGLALAAAFIVPISLTFAESKLTSEQKQELGKCSDVWRACEQACDGVGSSVSKGPLERAYCKQECEKKYDACVDKVVPRRAPRDHVSGGLSSPPQVAPPKSTPRKISPEQVGGVNTDRAGATTSPLPRKPIDRGSAAATAVKDAQSSTMTKTAISHKSPTPEPRKKKKE